MCTVTARSVENASAIATFVATTHLVLGVEVVQTSFPVQPDANPGDFVDYQFELTNTDPLSDHTVNATDIIVAEGPSPPNPQAINGVDGGVIAVAPPIDCCAAGTSQVFSVTVTLPLHARAGRIARN